MDALRACTELGVQTGETFLLTRSKLEGALPIVLAGTWQATDPDAAYWPRNPESALQTALLVRRQDYLSQVEPLLDVKVRTATWNLILERTQGRARTWRATTRKASTGRR